jgi:hypothetical protein
LGYTFSLIFADKIIPNYYRYRHIYWGFSPLFIPMDQT